MGTYKMIEGVTWADYAFQVEGKDLEDLFTSAGLAVCSAMVELDTVTPVKEIVVDLENVDIEKLLFSFLEEIVYLKDAEYMVFGKVSVEIKKEKTYKLHAILTGEEIDPKKHTLHADVKAVTYHAWKFEKTDKGYICQVVVDV